MKLTYNKLVKDLEKKVKEANKEVHVVKWLFFNSSFFCGYQNLNNEASSEAINKLNQYIDLYLNNNIPPQYILNKTFFFDYEFYVDNGCFIPRPETEQLVEEALYRIDERYGNKAITIADVCSGSGCIGITLAKEVKNAKVTLYELSHEASEIEKKNANNIQADVEIIEGDFIKPILDSKRKFDVIMCNPPYIKNEEKLDSLVVDNEPKMALFGGQDGLDFYRIIFASFNDILNDNGMMGFEFGYDQKEALENLIKETFKDLEYEFLKDYNKLDRMLFIYKK